MAQVALPQVAALWYDASVAGALLAWAMVPPSGQAESNSSNSLGRALVGGGGTALLDMGTVGNGWVCRDG